MSRDAALRALAPVVLALAVVACASPAVPSGSATLDPLATPAVVATWIADDDSVVVINVVATPGTQLRDLPRLARELRARYPDSRVVVHVFGSTAGPERYLIGRVPAGDEPVTPERRPPSWMASYDFPAMAGR